jgi:hypothetical protein
MIESRKKWEKNVPQSHIPYAPERRSHRIKYRFWRLYTTLHPYLHSVAKVVKRWPELYTVGAIAPGSSIERTVQHLVAHGYGYHREAWEDDGEVVGLRKVVSFTHQYHIRIYDNGEIRGHYEFTPEAYPLLHLFRIGQIEKREEFIALLKDHIIEYTRDDRA